MGTNIELMRQSYIRSSVIYYRTGYPPINQLKRNVSLRRIVMIYYEILCYSCKRKFKVYVGSLKYIQFKEKKNRIFCCEDCSHKIRMDAIKHFFR